MPNARSSISEHQFVMIIPSALAVVKPSLLREFLVGVDVGPDLAQLVGGGGQHRAVVPLDALSA